MSPSASLSPSLHHHYHHHLTITTCTIIITIASINEAIYLLVAFHVHSLVILCNLLLHLLFWVIIDGPQIHIQHCVPFPTSYHTYYYSNKIIIQMYTLCVISLWFFSVATLNKHAGSCHPTSFMTLV